MPNRQIGWSQEEILLSDILKQIGRLTEVIAQGGGGGGTGTVTSVTGTANRITITGTPTVAPVVDIAATYVGQTSITTLGTVTTGVWNGTVVSPVYGGTGVANNVASTLTISGAFATTLTVTGVTGVTLPTTGTLATLAGAESLTNKKLGSLTTNGFVKTSSGDGTLSSTANLSTTLSSANTITGTSSNTLKFIFDSLGVTQTDGAGHWLSNTTAAAAGAQQISPSLVLEGQGWKTAATPASQSVRFSQYVLPIQSGTNPTSRLIFASSINGVAYTELLGLSSAGVLTVGSIASLSGSAALSFAAGQSIGSNSSQLQFNTLGAAVLGYSAVVAQAVMTATSGSQAGFGVVGNFTPTSGNATYSGISVVNIINQTGGANGQVTILNLTPTYTATVNVTGIDYNPTVTSVTGTHLALRATSGNILIGATTLSANTGSKVMVLNNAATNATGAQTDGIVIHSKDSSAGSANATLALYLEQAVEAIGVTVSTHKLRFWHNGTEYYFLIATV